MDLTSLYFWIGVVGLFHLLLMVGEILPAGGPVVMGLVLRDKKYTDVATNLNNNPTTKQLMAHVVQNCGVYNGVVGTALIAAARSGPSAVSIQAVLLIGVMIAGAVGARTLKPIVWAQAAIGAAALVFLLWSTFRATH